MPVGIRISVRGIAEWKTFLASIPYGVKGIAARAFAEYVIGDSNHGLRHYPGYRYVSRKSAYGRTFFSDAQRRWFFANTPPIGNNRTYKLRSGWQITGQSTQLAIVNRVPYAGYVMGNNQARQPLKVGWRTAYDVIMSNYRGGIAAAQRAVNAWLSRK